MKKWIAIVSIIIIVGVGVLLGYFFLFKEKPTETPQEPQEETKVEPPKPKLKIIDESSNERPIAVMINNHSQAQLHHAGLQDAYVIYEMVAEGGLTRMMALFKDKTTSRIGSVRSSRHYFLDYALEHDAIYAHYGWSPQAEKSINSLGVNNINGLYDSSFFRDRTLNVAYEHTAFTSMELLKDMAAKKNYRLTTDKKYVLPYQIDPVDLQNYSDAIVANTVTVPFSYYVNPSYQYDSTRGVYLRFINGNAHIDDVTKEQYYFKNIIIMKVKNYSIDSYGRQTLENIGSGSGYYITNGYAIPITWEKGSNAGVTHYYHVTENGKEEISINDGNTFIEIEPTNQTPTIE